MALIKCSKCGNTVSDRASVCPNCGCEELQKLNCPECGGDISATDTICPHCGFPLTPQCEKTTQPEKTLVQGKSDTNVNEASSTGEKHTVQTQFKENRNVLVIMLLSAVTLGIYGIYYYSTVIRDLNHICEEDGEKTPGIIQFILLSMITFGIYGIYWHYKACTRTLNYQKAHQAEAGIELKPPFRSSAFLIWYILGSLLFGVGPIVAVCFFTRNINNISKIYNRTCYRYGKPIQPIQKKPIIIIVAVIVGVYVLLTVAITVAGIGLSSAISDDLNTPTDIEEPIVDDNSDVDDDVSKPDDVSENYEPQIFKTEYYSVTVPEIWKNCKLEATDVDLDNGYGYSLAVYSPGYDQVICGIDLMPTSLGTEPFEIDGICTEVVGTMEVTRIGEFAICAYYTDENTYEPDSEYFPETYDDYIEAVGFLVGSMTMNSDRGEIYFNW